MGDPQRIWEPRLAKKLMIGAAPPATSGPSVK
jgi:hypothetical protein